jgi:hypothetical protein
MPAPGRFPITRIPRSARVTAIVLAGLLAVGLASCSSEKSASSSAASSVSAEATGDGDFADASSAAAAGSADSEPSAAASAAAPAAGVANEPTAGTTSPAVLANRQIVYTADITIQAASVPGVVTEIEALAQSPTVEGAIYAEQIDLTPKDSSAANATITLKVPPTALEGTLDRIAGLGTELNRDEHANDVTTQVSDTNARLTAARDSLNRLEQLFQHAGTVGDLTNLEAQIAQRESDLDSLESQQKALSAEVAQATITATVVSAPVVVKPTPKPKKAHVFGFLRGLRGGWHAFTRTTAALATAVGAALPFLLVLAGLGALALLVRRYVIPRRPGTDHPQEG